MVHGLRGKPSARRKPPALRAQVLAKYEEKDYADFGPTLGFLDVGDNGEINSTSCAFQAATHSLAKSAMSVLIKVAKMIEIEIETAELIQIRGQV